MTNSSGERKASKTLYSVFASYGSFFGLTHPISISFLFSCSMLCPLTGLTGLLGASIVLLLRRILDFSQENESIEVINGLLLGMLIGSLYVPSAGSMALLFFGALLVVLGGQVFNDILTRPFRLPMLGLPYVFAGCVVISLAQAFKLPLLIPNSVFSFFSLIPQDLHLNWSTSYLSGIGSIYFNGTILGALLVLAAFLASSPYLAGLTLLCAVATGFMLQMVNVSLGSITFLVAQMNGILTGAVIGGLYTKPGKRSLLVALMAALLASVTSLAIEHHLWSLGLPALAMPFVLGTYAVLIALSPARGGAWSKFWLPKPALPESSMEEQKICETRGIDPSSVAVRLPVQGVWHVYQGIGGKHTHQKQWHYSIDLFRLVKGKSFKSDGKFLSDYYCYAKPVFSPVYGTIVDLCSHHNDNLPGEVDTKNNWGNYIIILLDTGSYMVLAHLQKDSIKMEKYARVVPGQELAACGNSGRSPQPHLHMSIHKNMNLTSQTIPFHFTHAIVCNGKNEVYTLNTRPREGDTLVTPRRNAALKRAFHLNVGCRLQFDTLIKGKLGSTTLDVVLDLYGQFWLVSNTGACAAFSVTDDLVAFYHRSGPDDLVLDAFLLAVGLSPLIEGSASWSDLVPRQTLPANIFVQFYNNLLNPFNSCVENRLERNWEPLRNTWNQSATQTLKLPLGKKLQYLTRARLCESLGLVELEMKENGKTILTASLVGQTRRADNGIPELKTLRYESGCH